MKDRWATGSISCLALLLNRALQRRQTARTENLTPHSGCYAEQLERVGTSAKTEIMDRAIEAPKEIVETGVPVETA